MSVDPSKVSADKPVSFAQIAKVARLMVEVLGEDWPADRRAMSELIGRYEQAATPSVKDEIPL